MPDDISTRVLVLRFASSGIWRRVTALIQVAFTRGDVVHVSGDVHFALMGVRRRRGVLTVHDCGLAASANPFVRGLYRWVWLKLPARRAGQLVAVSESTRDELTRLTGVAADRIAVIPTTIDDTFVPAPARPVPDAPTVLCFGSTANKNLSGTIDALRGTALHLNVVGALDDAMTAKLADSGLSWTNASAMTDDELRQWYVDSDVVLFPSTYEGFGMPIVEGQAVGRPVVTSDRAPMNDVAGGAACLVDPDDPASIRAGVERVLGDAAYRVELIKKGYENRERFRPAVAARAYAEIYREMAAKS